MAASADQVAAASTSQAPAGMGSPGGMAGVVQDIQQMAAVGGRGVRGKLKSIVGSVKATLRGQRAQMR